MTTYKVTVEVRSWRELDAVKALADIGVVDPISSEVRTAGGSDLIPGQTMQRRKPLGIRARLEFDLSADEAVQPIELVARVMAMATSARTSNDCVVTSQHAKLYCSPDDPNSRNILNVAAAQRLLGLAAA